MDSKNRNYIKCNYCNLIIQIADVKKHMLKKHPEAKNNCPICKARQLEILGIDDHILDAHKDHLIAKADIIKCKNCNCNFNWNDYVEHAENCAKKSNQFKCIKCGRNLKFQDLLIHHRNITCPKFVQSKIIKILDDQEYTDLKIKKKNYQEILTPVGGQPKNKK